MKSLWKVLLPLVALGLLASCTSATLPAVPAATEATLQTTGSIAGEQTFTAETLRALGTRETACTNKDGETTTYTSVPFTTLLDAVGATADITPLIFAASNGYEAQAMLADVTACDGCIVAFQDQGGFRVVLCSHSLYGVADFTASVRKMEATRHVWGQPYDSPTFQVAYNALLQLGIFANVVLEDSSLWKPWTSASLDEALVDVKRRLDLVDDATHDAFLRDLLARPFDRGRRAMGLAARHALNAGVLGRWRGP
jgi:hypothetical protein